MRHDLVVYMCPKCGSNGIEIDIIKHRKIKSRTVKLPLEPVDDFKYPASNYIDVVDDPTRYGAKCLSCGYEYKWTE